MNGGSLTRILEYPQVYLTWQGPFIRQKIAPVLKDIQLSDRKRILDIGCGPGTNTKLFADRHDYIGVDLSPEYVEFASKKHGRPFFVCDVTKDPLPSGPFDLVLINSLMHHLSDDEVGTLLGKALGVLAPQGELQIIDLILPDNPCMARFLANHDRGDFPRPLEKWRTLFSRHFQLEALEEFPVGFFNYPMWVMVHARGRTQ